MITDVHIVYNDDSQIKKIGDTLKVYPFFHFIDDRTAKGRKEAYRLKSHYAARLTTFAVVYDKDKAIKAFYTEADSDIINSLIKYLNDNLCS